MRERFAYHQSNSYPEETAAPYNVNKWSQTFLQAVQQSNKTGASVNSLLDQMTKSWDIIEQQDFRRWVLYYQGDNQMKYKTAQMNIGLLKATLPPVQNNDHGGGSFNMTIDPNSAEMVERKIRSIISRLTAAEKIATDPVTRAELDKRLDVGFKKWMEELHWVKRQIQTANIRNAKSTLPEELIIRRGSKLIKDGFPKAGKMMMAIAQEPTSEGAESKEDEVKIAPPQPLPEVKLPGAPSKPQPSNKISPQKTKPSSNEQQKPTGGLQPPIADEPLQGERAINSLIEGMNGDMDDADDNSFIIDIDDDPIATMHLVAQEAPPPMVSPTQQEVGEEPLSVELSESPEDQLIPEEDRQGDQGVDVLLDDALENISVEDLIYQLEVVVNMLRKRELPRLLSRIDLMMDALQFSSFFPQMGEAQAKALDANQYQLTRMDEILSKVRGAVKTEPAVTLNVETEESSDPMIQNMKKNLTEQDNLDKARKERRKQEELNKGDVKPQTSPAQAITNVKEDLSKPITSVTQPPRQIRAPQPLPQV